MSGFLSVEFVAIVVTLLALGIALIGVSVVRMRRGEAGTRRETARLARVVGRRGRDLPAAVAESLVLASRTFTSWVGFGLGVASLLSGACSGVFLALHNKSDLVDSSSFLVVMAGSLAGLYPGAFIGALVGLARMRREPGGADALRLRPHRRDYRPALVPLLPFLVYLANIIFMAVLVMRLEQHFSATLEQTLALPGMWSAVVVPAILLILFLATVLAMPWVGSLRLLYLPSDTPVRQRVDNAMRRMAIGLLGAFYVFVAFELGMGQLVALNASFDPSTPLALAGLDGWYFLYLGVVLLCLVVLLLGYVVAAARMVFAASERKEPRP